MKDSKKNGMSLKEMWKEPRYKAMIKMGLWLALIVIIIVYINISAALSSNVNTTIPNVKDTSNKNDLLTRLSNLNYAFNIDVTINDGEEKKINYHGKRNSHEVFVVKSDEKNNTEEFYISDDSFYIKTNDQYELTNINDIFDSLEYRYLQLDNIKEYLKKGNIEHTTNSNQENLTTVIVPVNSILINKNTTDTIKIDILEETDKLTVTIDYTNLMKINNDKIINYQVKTQYYDIDKIENELRIVE